MEKLGPVLEGMSPTERKALETSSMALSSKIVGEALSMGQAMQALAVALTALNAYREAKGESPIDPEQVNPMMLASMMDELIRDQDFLDFLQGQVEVEVESEESEEEGMEEEESSEVVTPASLMNRRNTLMGAM